MDWVDDFYSVTGTWWESTLSEVDVVDRGRAAFVHRYSPNSVNVLELGCGHGATAAAIAGTGRRVVGIDVSARVEQTVHARSGVAGLELQRGDFYKVDLGQRFDVVCYWDGFGVGDDADQIRLLRRVGGWLADEGVAIVEVFHPSGWAADDGLDEIKAPLPERGLLRHLGHRRSYDSATDTAQDTWWEVGESTEWTQFLRCYRRERIAEMAAEAGLELVSAIDAGALGGASFDAEIAEPCWSYICVFARP